jgi:hypothetical protein
MNRDNVIRLMLAAVAGVGAAVYAQKVVPAGPRHDFGQSVTPAYEGWFQNPDGTFSLMFGYFNRNYAEQLDIPIGPENRFEPGPADRGQPTHFPPRRAWGVFTVTVPKDFGSSKLTWTLTSNGETISIPASLDSLWLVEPLKDATNNTPPYLSFSEKGPFVQGPQGQSTSLSASVGTPLELSVWAADDANVAPGATKPRTPAVTLLWNKFRGPGHVTFSNQRPAIQEAQFSAPPNTVFHGKSVTTATFSEPGDYVLHVIANDWSGEGGRGFVCCWTNAQVKVQVK